MVNILRTILLSGLIFISAAQPKDDDVLPGFQSLKSLEPLGTAFAEYFHNVTLKGLDLVNPRLPTQQDLLCLKHLTELVSALSSGEYWALKSE